MKEEDVYTSVVRWLTKTLGVTVIRSHQSGPTPSLPYVMVNYVDSSPVRAHEMRIDYITLDGDEEEETRPFEAKPVIEMEWFFSIHSYGPSPTSILRPLVSASRLSQVMEPMFPGLVIHELSPIRRVPDWINEGWEPRGQVDLRVRGVIEDGHIIDVIEEYEIQYDKPY